jgi:hypothetical protein
MKRTTTLRRCTWISVASAFALAWVSYWATVALVIIAVVFATAWLVSDCMDYANEQERVKQYHERLKAK